MRVAVITSMVVGLLLPTALAYVLLSRLLPTPRWARYAGAVVGLATGFYLVFGLMFPDTLRRPTGPPITVEVVLPDRYHGFVYLFFDARQAPLQLSHPGIYTLMVPANGRLRAGQFPGQQASAGNVVFAMRYLNGEPAPVVEGSEVAGAQLREADSVFYHRAFVGSKAELEAASPAAEDPMQVLERMREQASRPPEPFQPSSLEGIDHVPAP